MGVPHCAVADQVRVKRMASRVSSMEAKYSVKKKGVEGRKRVPMCRRTTERLKGQRRQVSPFFQKKKKVKIRVIFVPLATAASANRLQTNKSPVDRPNGSMTIGVCSDSSARKARQSWTERKTQSPAPRPPPQVSRVKKVHPLGRRHCKHAETPDQPPR